MPRRGGPSGALRIESIFKTDNTARDKFLSRLFGIFNEEIVRIWCADERAPFGDIGRPTLYDQGDSRGQTFDFTFRRRSDGTLYVGELKCELEFEGYRYLRLFDSAQLDHHRGSRAFSKFLRAAAAPRSMLVKVAGREVQVSGAILVWGAMTPEAQTQVAVAEQLQTVLSIEALLNDLHQWGSTEWAERVGELGSWTHHLFSALRGSDRTNGVPGADER